MASSWSPGSWGDQLPQAITGCVLRPVRAQFPMNLRGVKHPELQVTQKNVLCDYVMPKLRFPPAKWRKLLMHKCFRTKNLQMKVVVGTGFEPVKAKPADLQSAPVDRLGILPPKKRGRCDREEMQRNSNHPTKSRVNDPHIAIN